MHPDDTEWASARVVLPITTLAGDAYTVAGWAAPGADLLLLLRRQHPQLAVQIDSGAALVSDGVESAGGRLPPESMRRLLGAAPDGFAGTAAVALVWKQAGAAVGVVAKEPRGARVTTR